LSRVSRVFKEKIQGNRDEEIAIVERGLMRVQVEVICLPHPREEIEATLRAAGEQLALTADSVSVRMDPTEPRIAVLEFEMRRGAQYKVVDDISETVKSWAWEFYEDITVRFPKS
jgi:hypothetical protein